MTLLIRCFITFILLLTTGAVDDPDISRDTIGIIESRGYQAETHFITTRDQYILSVHRIINPLVRKLRKLKRPILLQHGLFSSSIDFIINTPSSGVNYIPYEKFVNESVHEHNIIGNNLGFVLSDLGYDIWLGNSRGNLYSNHTFFDQADNEFWYFSIDEMVDYDLPAIIDHILAITKQKNLGYIGHSQGSLIMFGLLATQPKYNEIIKPFIALAPVATVKHIRSPIRLLANSEWLMDYHYNSPGKFMPTPAMVNHVVEYLCSSHTLRSFCYNAAFLFCGFDFAELNITRIPVYYAHTPSGTSSWNMVHYGQMHLSGKFQRFDYGRAMNWKIYGNFEPPLYDLKRITSKNIALIFSKNDWMSDAKDVLNLIQTLKGPLLLTHQIEQKNWNHLDFIWGKHSGAVVNTVIVNLLRFLDSSRN